MKAFKILGIAVGVVVVLVAVVLALALTPSIQTWAVRKAAAGQPGVTLDVSRVAVGPNAADITELRYAKDGMVVTAKGVSARYSAWDYLTKDLLNADSVTVSDLVIDLRNVSPAGTPAPGQAGDGRAAPRTGKAPVSPQPKSDGKKAVTPFEGLLTQAQLPFDVRVSRLDVKGRALLPNNQIATFELKGGGIESGQRGKLEWTIDFADSTPEAPLRALRTTGTAGIHVAKDRRIDLVEIDAIAAAMGPKLPPDRVQLTAKAEQPTAGGNEGYAASVALLRGSTVEPILKTSAQYLAESREITGAWELSVRSEQLGALLEGLGLPRINSSGGGKFTLKPDAMIVAASGDLQGEAAQLEKISPALAAVGSMRFALSFDGGLADTLAQLNKLQLEATGADGRKFAQVSATQKLGYDLTSKRVTFTDPKAELARISVQALPLAWVQPVVAPMTIESGDLSLVLAVTAEPDGSRVHVRAVEPLAVRTVTLRDGEQTLIDRLTLTTRPTIDYSAARVTAELGDLKLALASGDELTGRLAADVTNLPANPVIAFTSDLRANIVAALKPYLPAGLDLGLLTFTSVTEGRLENDQLHLAKATTNLNRANGALLGSIELQQPIRADLKASTFTATNPNATAVRLRLGEIPLAWAEAFVEKSKFAGALAGGVFDVSMRSVEDLTLTTAEPLSVRGAGATLDGKPMAQALDISVNLTATKRGEAIGYEVRRIEVKQGPAVLAGFSVAGEARMGAKPAIAAKGNLDADVAALMKQPALVPFATLTQGRIAASFEASLAEATQAKVSLSAKNLVAKEGNRALGDLELTLNAAMKPDGSGTITMPLTLTNAQRKSDLAVNASFGKAANRETFLLSGKVASNQIIVDDFQPLAGLAPASEKPKTPEPPKPTRDEQPFWKGVNGKLDLDLKRVVYGKDYVVNNVRGSATITDSRLALDGLEGSFRENPFKLAAGVTFAAQQPKPYSLTGSVDITNLQLGEILRAANPNEKPAIESLVNVVARLNGNGGTVGDLAKNVYGKFDVTGTRGVLRALGRKTEIAGAASTLLGIAGALAKSDTTMAIAEVTAAFAELEFDTFKMQVERGADLNVKLTNIEFISALMRTTGSGQIANRGDAALQNQPMEIMLQFGAKNQLADLLAKVGALGDRQDERGYRLLQRTFTVGGTAAKPDSNSLWTFLLREAATRGAPALQDLLNRRR